MADIKSIHGNPICDSTARTKVDEISKKLTGGVGGAVLTKRSNDPYDYFWNDLGTMSYSVITDHTNGSFAITPNTVIPTLIIITWSDVGGNEKGGCALIYYDPISGLNPYILNIGAASDILDNNVSFGENQDGTLIFNFNEGVTKYDYDIVYSVRILA